MLGGSFNPAHPGHRHIAALARRALALDQVWLVVSPGNPLKPPHGMAPLPARLASAKRIGDGRRVVATAIESRLGTRFTFDTLRGLRRRFPRVRFVWIAGADILEQLPHWQRWREIARLVPFAILPRPGYNHRALAGRATRALHAARRPARAAATLALQAPPAWVFLSAPQHAASAAYHMAQGRVEVGIVSLSVDLDLSDNRSLFVRTVQPPAEIRFVPTNERLPDCLLWGARARSRYFGASLKLQIISHPRCKENNHRILIRV